MVVRLQAILGGPVRMSRCSSRMRLTGVALHTPTGLHHHNRTLTHSLAPAPATSWQQEQEQEQEARSSRQELETVGQKLGELQKSLLEKQTYLAKVRGAKCIMEISIGTKTLCSRW